MMARWGGPMIPRQYEALAALAAQPDSVLVANPGVLAARLVQEKLGVPTASLLLQPGLLPSNTAPPEMPGGLTIPPWLPHPLRRLYWLGVDAAAYALVAPSLNRARAGLRIVPGPPRLPLVAVPGPGDRAVPRPGMPPPNPIGRRNSASPGSAGSTGRGRRCPTTCGCSAKKDRRRSRSPSAPA